MTVVQVLIITGIFPACMLRTPETSPIEVVFVRLRITRAITGSIDGIQLNHLISGEIYEIGTAVGSYLLAIGAAEPVAEEGPALVVPTVRWQAKERRIPLTRPSKSSDSK